jgi:hypothetical protein
MKVLDLQCALGHSFEGWFGSQADYDAQRDRGLVTCPVCNDSDITKKLSAPRLNLGHGLAPDPTPAQGAPATGAGAGAGAGGLAGTPSGRAVEVPPSAPTLPDVAPETLQQLQAAMVKMVRHVMANTEDVGTQFAEEARKIHYGEREERNIRGQATREETEALIDEGIDVMPLPVPENLKGPLQ